MATKELLPFHSVVEEQHDDITFDSSQGRPKRMLNAATATLALVLDIEAQVDIAAGGGADGALNVEQPLGLVRMVRINDGSTSPIVEATPAELRQLTERRGMKAQSGVALANPGVQAATLVRQQIIVPLSDPWTANKKEVFLRPRVADSYNVEIEWAGTTNAALAAALITGGTRVITVSNLKVKVLQVHDPILFLRRLPLFVPRIISYESTPVPTSTQFEVEIKTPRWVRAILLHSVDAQITTEGIINRLTLEDDQRTYRKGVYARTWHELEQWRFGGVSDDTGVGMAYFFTDFADGGKLGNLLAPKQGGRPRWKFDSTGSATRLIRSVQVEYERVPGIVQATLPEVPA